MPHQDFLNRLTIKDITGKPFPVQQLLPYSFYYPSSGIDGQVVKHFGQKTQSFFMSDYLVPKAKLENALDNFRGYEVFASKDLPLPELHPNGRQEVLPPNFPYAEYTANARGKVPYGLWAVYQRKKEFGEDHGPNRFSLVYLGGEGVAGYQALYWSNRTKPLYLAIIQPGEGFGGNWTRYADVGLPMEWIVRNNPAGLPRYIVYGGYGENYKDLSWPGYVRIARIAPYYAGGVGGEVLVMQNANA